LRGPQQRGFWFIVSKVPWLEGRGRFVSIGLWLVAIYGK